MFLLYRTGLLYLLEFMSIKIKFYILYLLTGLLFFGKTQAQQPFARSIDSLKLLADSINRVLPNVEDSVVFLKLLNKQRHLFKQLDSTTAGNKLKDVFAVLDNKRRWLYVRGLQKIAEMYTDKKRVVEGIDLLTKARTLAGQWNLKTLEGRINLQQGTIYQVEHQYEEALIHFLKAYEIFFDLNDKKNAGDALYYVALRHYHDEDYEKAVASFRKAIAWGKKVVHYRQVINSWNAIGLIYKNKSKLDSARFYYDKALNFATEKKDSAWIGIMNGNIGSLYYLQGNYKRAEKGYLVDAKMSMKYKVWGSLANVLAALGNVYREQGRYALARQYYDSTLKVCEIYERYNSKERAYKGLAQLMRVTSRFEEANNYLMLYLEVKDSLRRRQISNKLLKQRLAYKYREQRNKIELLTNQNELKTTIISRQNAWNTLIGFALVMVLVLAIVLYRNVQLKLKTNRQLRGKQTEIITQNQILQQQREEIASQRDAIEKKNQVLETRNMQVESSIRAALAIQNALLPHEHKMERLLKHYFVLYKPRDVVSGDFYWISNTNGYLYIAAIDCTGHGVPGAFMSLIANTLLDKVLRSKNKVVPADILKQLHKEVKKALRPEDTGHGYGMDIGLLAMKQPDDNDTWQLTFAGAKRSLYYIVNEGTPQMKETGNDRFSIGANYSREVYFTNHKLYLPKGSLLYLSTDGIADQNNSVRRSFTSTQLKNILLQNHSLPLPRQKNKLEEILQMYMADTEQRDDMLLLGIKLV